MFDFLRVEARLPDDGVDPEQSFQTWSLYGSVEHFSITAQGRLIHHRLPGPQVAAAGDRLGRPGSGAVEDIDMDFHGDLEFFGRTTNNRSAHYVARFTHGKLEWIHRLEGPAGTPRDFSAVTRASSFTSAGTRPDW